MTSRGKMYLVQIWYIRSFLGLSKIGKYSVCLAIAARLERATYCLEGRFGLFQAFQANPLKQLILLVISNVYHRFQPLVKTSQIPLISKASGTYLVQWPVIFQRSILGLKRSPRSWLEQSLLQNLTKKQSKFLGIRTSENSGFWKFG